MSKNMVGPERPQMEIWRRAACWVIKATHAQAHAHARAPTHARTEVCNTYYFPRQQWLRERASMLRYTYIACLVEC